MLSLLTSSLFCGSGDILEVSRGVGRLALLVLVGHAHHQRAVLTAAF